MSTIKIGIADDHRLFREGMRMILSGMENISIGLEAGSGKELMEQLARNPVDIVLLDIEMKDMNGVDTLKALSRIDAKPRVIVLSMHTEPRMMRYMMELGASGYLPKDVQPQELETAIRAVFEKGVYLSEAVSMSLLSGLKNSNHKHLPVIELSPREKEILELICLEYTTKEIGEKLFISERTVEGHRKNLCIKLDAKNTAGLVKKALQLNLVGN
jgi:DNA-binding NarL/FixJ family response regulator